MPKEISVEEINDVLPRTTSAVVKRAGDYVKYKLRTKKTLYTVKVKLDESEKVKGLIENSTNNIIIETADN